MASLLRSPHWRRCLQGAAAHQRRQLGGSALASGASTDKPFEDIQDPAKTHPAYSGGAGQPGGRQVPGPGDEGVEREVVWGKNIPASAEQAKEEVKYAGQGLADSVEMGVNVLLSKAKDAAAQVKRAVGMESERGPEMSHGGMGAAGKMEHAPPGTKSGFNSGPLSEDLARAKYEEIAGTEKPAFPEGEQSVNEMFPDMKVAAGEQSNTPNRQREENENIRRELHAAGASTDGGSAPEPGMAASGMSDTPMDTLNENLHNRGP